ncbi:hypothetical protein BGW36DRAFT_377328 [Talaromyces proteolyticus]|uniref:F-box domain-containing protein n=1 Tax=Talaromyces proteolyticus TaxID=1131652 RepID=A0AAD4KXS6_9EURO|nr:uncharacterized protein BGW36DRAFT_377328 [Talaromyces proteolyticus]KAH8699127.1 hypothetical protein BGW36DRAFT_377328 [Talaromyces proteolyticus]
MDGVHEQIENMSESGMTDTSLPVSNSTYLMDLPTELHLHIASFLSYPDALALKHANRHFYSFVYTGVHLKVDWLVERFEHKLECPMEKCSFRTDEAFCNRRIRRIMERRRRHLECKPGARGCFVIEGGSCKKDVVPIWLKKELRYWKGWKYEVLIFGLLFLFWTLVWDAVGRTLFNQHPTSLSLLAPLYSRQL